jgi:hypothetical protein
VDHRLFGKYRGIPELLSMTSSLVFDESPELNTFGGRAENGFLRWPDRSGKQAPQTEAWRYAEIVPFANTRHHTRMQAFSQVQPTTNQRSWSRTPFLLPAKVNMPVLPTPIGVHDPELAWLPVEFDSVDDVFVARFPGWPSANASGPRFASCRKSDPSAATV